MAERLLQVLLTCAATTFAWAATTATSGRFWSVSTGTCTINSQGCAQSPNFPASYRNQDSCIIQIVAADWQSYKINVVAFNTELNSDVLNVNGVPYSGSAGPQGVVPFGSLSWTTDSSITRSGWQLCPVVVTSTSTSETRTTTAVTPFWTVLSGDCQRVISTGCLRSPNYPSSYPNSDTCVIWAWPNDWVGFAIQVKGFNTERGYDILSVNGMSISGSSGAALNGVVPVGEIRWTTDRTTVSSGWELCPSRITTSSTASTTIGTTTSTTKSWPTLRTTSTTTTTTSMFWTVTSGSCTIDAKACAMSPNYPAVYPIPQSCELSVTSGDWSGYDLRVISFDTAPQDTLTVNGVAYSGNGSGLDGLVPNGLIEWSSSQGRGYGGWYLCPVATSQSASSPSESFPGGLFSGWTLQNMIYVIVFPTVAAVSCLIAGCAFWCWRRRKQQVAIPRPPTSPPSAFVPAPTRVPPYATFPPTPATPRGPGSVPSTPRVRRPPSEHQPWIQRKLPSVPVPADECLCPGHWLNHGGLSFLSFEPASAEENIFLQRMLDTTRKAIRTRDRTTDLVPKRFQLSKAQRIENGELWQKFAMARFGLKTARPHKCTPASSYGGQLLTEQDLPALLKESLQTRVNEVYLWHGTSPEAGASIAGSGFKLGFSGTHAGTMYGPGAYFAECSSKSDEYASDSPEGPSSGLCCLLLCRVVLGELLHLTTGGSATHDIVKAAMESAAYDSVLGDREASAGTYREFVVFQEEQVYPEYLIFYKRIW